MAGAELHDSHAATIAEDRESPVLRERRCSHIQAIARLTTTCGQVVHRPVLPDDPDRGAVGSEGEVDDSAMPANAGQRTPVSVPNAHLALLGRGREAAPAWTPLAERSSPNQTNCTRRPGLQVPEPDALAPNG